MSFSADLSSSSCFSIAVCAYGSAPSSTSFLTFLASFLPDSPHKRLRFKTILFIQGSQLYDIDSVRSRLDHEPALSVLSIERAIIFGKVSLNEFPFCSRSKLTHTTSSFPSFTCTTKPSTSSLEHYETRSQPKPFVRKEERSFPLELDRRSLMILDWTRGLLWVEER